MPRTQNLYTYVGNNPVNFVDPTGYAECEAATNCRDKGATDAVPSDAPASTVVDSITSGPFRYDRMSDGTLRSVYVGETEKEIDSIYVNPDGTLTVKYKDGSFDYVKDYPGKPGTYQQVSVCFKVICINVAHTDSDGLWQPSITFSASLESVSATWYPPADYNGDPRSLQHITANITQGGLVLVLQPTYDLNTGQFSLAAGAGTPQLGGGITLPLPAFAGPPMPQTTNPNSAQMVR